LCWRRIKGELLLKVEFVFLGMLILFARLAEAVQWLPTQAFRDQLCSESIVGELNSVLAKFNLGKAPVPIGFGEELRTVLVEAGWKPKRARVIQEMIHATLRSSSTDALTRDAIRSLIVALKERRTAVCVPVPGEGGEVRFPHYAPTCRRGFSFQNETEVNPVLPYDVFILPAENRALPLGTMLVGLLGARLAHEQIGKWIHTNQQAVTRDPLYELAVLQDEDHLEPEIEEGLAQFYVGALGGWTSLHGRLAAVKGRTLSREAREDLETKIYQRALGGGTPAFHKFLKAFNVSPSNFFFKGLALHQWLQWPQSRENFFKPIDPKERERVPETGPRFLALLREVLFWSNPNFKLAAKALVPAENADVLARLAFGERKRATEEWTQSHLSKEDAQIAFFTPKGQYQVYRRAMRKFFEQDPSYRKAFQLHLDEGTFTDSELLDYLRVVTRPHQQAAAWALSTVFFANAFVNGGPQGRGVEIHLLNAPLAREAKQYLSRAVVLSKTVLNQASYRLAGLALVARLKGDEARAETLESKYEAILNSDVVQAIWRDFSDWGLPSSARNHLRKQMQILWDLTPGEDL
jgi:hypothetical protein